MVQCAQHLNLIKTTRKNECILQKSEENQQQQKSIANNKSEKIFVRLIRRIGVRIGKKLIAYVAWHLEIAEAKLNFNESDLTLPLATRPVRGNNK